MTNQLKLTFVALFIAVGSFAQTQPAKVMDAKLVNKAAVPGPVVAGAEKDFPDASPFKYYMVGETNVNRDWKVAETVDLSPGETMSFYKVEMKGKNAHFDALYDASGKLVMSKQEQTNVALPPAVLNAWASSEYKSSGLAKDKHVKVIDHGKNQEYYVLTMKDGKKVTYDATGKLVKK